MCLNVINENIPNSLNPSCLSNDLIYISTSIFFGLLYNRKTLNGGAIYCSWDLMNSNIINSLFDQCRSNNGGAIYFNLCNKNTFLSNCFYNCSATTSSSAFLILNKLDSSNIQNNFTSFIYCPWNKLGSYDTFLYNKGSAKFSNLNISKTQLLGRDCISIESSKYYFEIYSNYIYNEAHIIFRYHTTYYSIIKNINVINNTKSPNSEYNCIIFDYIFDSNLTNSIFLNNFDLIGRNLLYYNYLKLFDNKFFNNDFISSNISLVPSTFNFFLNNLCNSNVIQSKSINFSFNFKLFLILFNI